MTWGGTGRRRTARPLPTPAGSDSPTFWTSSPPSLPNATTQTLPLSPSITSANGGGAAAVGDEEEEPGARVAGLGVDLRRGGGAEWGVGEGQPAGGDPAR